MTQWLNDPMTQFRQLNGFKNFKKYKAETFLRKCVYNQQPDERTEGNKRMPRLDPTNLGRYVPLSALFLLSR